MRRLRFWMIPTFLIVFALGVVIWASIQPENKTCTTLTTDPSERTGNLITFSGGRWCGYAP